MIPPASISPLSSPTTNKITPSSSSLLNDNTTRLGAPIRLFHQGRSTEEAYTLYAPDEVNRKSWCEAIEKQRDIKFKRKPAFGIVDIAKRYEFFADIKAHHMVLFGIVNKNHETCLKYN